MPHDETNGTDRRTFLQAGALATAAAAAAGLTPDATAQEAAKKAEVPRRVLGKTGVEITMLDQGAVRSSAYNNVLRLSYASGVRVFDTAKVYGTEPALRDWFRAAPEVRKSIFLVTKDNPKVPKDMLAMIDARLKSLETDHIDLFFVHGLGDDHTADQALAFIKSREFKETADAIRKSGKAKFIGFSTHHPQRAAFIQAAAEGGVVDAIMLQYTPWLDKESPLNKALDAAHKAGIGLISMKQFAGKGAAGAAKKGATDGDVIKHVPMLADKKLSPFQGLLHAIWTDERISSVCVSMRNTDQVRENADAARRYEPMKMAEIRELRDAFVGNQTLCADCDGRCAHAAGTEARLGDITRFLTYHQHLGDRTEARRQFAALPAEARDWAGADLDAAREACPNGLDFASLLPEAERHLA